MSDRFPFPPTSLNADGDLRAVGIEIECGGVDAGTIAPALGAAFGGTCRTQGAVWHVTGTSLGDIEVYLDTAYKETVSQSGLLQTLAEGVVPVEIVTSPIPLDKLHLLDELEQVLRGLGAQGSRAAPQFGFGVHLNVEVVDTALDGWWPTFRAYALIEPALRRQDMPNAARRLLPFITPYPESLLGALHAGSPADTAAATDLYLAHAPSRNHALDMLPLMAHLHKDKVQAAVGGKAAGGARPAFHYRLPETRLDEDTWSLAYEWQRWCAIERIADDAALMEQLTSIWVGSATAIARRTALAAAIAPFVPDPFS
ncbi:MAG: amidoligase family protein [Pseudomonadota bacterium]